MTAAVARALLRFFAGVFGVTSNEDEQGDAEREDGGAEGSGKHRAHDIPKSEQELGPHARAHSVGELEPL